MRFQPVCDDSHSSRVHGDACRLKLRCHTTAATPRLASRESFDVGSDFLDLRDEFGIGIFARIVSEEAVDIGEENQQRGFEFTHDKRAELVVVTETAAAIGYFKFARRDRVVFVDDRNHTHIEQCRQRMT